MEISLGMNYTIKLIVNESNVASKYDDNLPKVFSTPDMIAAMETASYKCILPILPKGKMSVGTHVNVSHNLAISMGNEIIVKATVVEVDRRKVVFNVIATSSAGDVGSGTHTRFIVDKESFDKI